MPRPEDSADIADARQLLEALSSIPGDRGFSLYSLVSNVQDQLEELKGKLQKADELAGRQDAAMVEAVSDVRDLAAELARRFDTARRGP